MPRFYPEVSADRCTACLLLDVDPVGMARGKGAKQNFLLAQYVNDRPYVASSFMSVAISQVFGSALQGRSRERAEMTTTPIPLEAQIDVLPVRGGERFLHEIFEPLGYVVPPSATSWTSGSVNGAKVRITPSRFRKRRRSLNCCRICTC